MNDLKKEENLLGLSSFAEEEAILRQLQDEIFQSGAAVFNRERLDERREKMSQNDVVAFFMSYDL